MLRERDLAERWAVSQRTLQRWRAEGYGPAWINIGGSIRYKLATVEAFEGQMQSGRDGA
ncbi:helix-turn-helix domain-containing protein [Jannaschia ovalis]|uniref:helix-turn-helix domain-containing protein n=1 Tax=Jannaschia ovalis TaxID=3038773 RepID=UPI003264971C